jgi:hypothetical protein
VLLLRRFPSLWRESVPVEVDLGDLGAQLGLGGGAGRHRPIARTVERIVRFRFATRSQPGALDVFTEVPRHRVEPMTRAQRPAAREPRDARDPTLGVRDAVREPARFFGHTLAGFPPGNLLATLRAPGASR